MAPFPYRALWVSTLGSFLYLDCLDSLESHPCLLCAYSMTSLTRILPEKGVEGSKLKRHQAVPENFGPLSLWVQLCLSIFLS